MIYLDYSANTPVDPAVLERFCQVEGSFIGNPNSAHGAGREAADELARVTESIAELLGVSAAELIYTSGVSEANNLAIKGLAHAERHLGKHIISTALEHASVGGCLTGLQEGGYEVDLVDIGRDGRVDLEHLRALLRKDTVLVAVTAVDSELGTVQPIAQIGEQLKAYPDCRLHVDATQAAGKHPLYFEGVDTLSIGAHKIYGLNGSGLLFKRRGVAMEPLLHGGGQQHPLPQWHPHSGPGGCSGDRPLPGTVPSGGEGCADPEAQCVSPGCPGRLSQSAHQQPGGCRAPYPQSERGGGQGQPLPAGAG